jgi:hypothetical protein
MRNSFISLICVVQYPDEFSGLNYYLEQVHRTLSENFSDLEIILVNNTAARKLEQWAGQLDPLIRQHVYVLNLSSPVNRNHAVLAGFDRANGDYAVLFELAFADKPGYIVQLFDKAHEGNDIVYLQASSRKSGWKLGLFHKLFYYILRHYSDLRIDERAHNTRIVSRRALNSILRMRENLRYMKAIYSIVGFRTASIPVEEPLLPDPEERFSEQFRTSLVAITSFTSFLRSLLFWIFIISLTFLIVVVANAVKVKFTNYDILGKYHEALSGWTFLVVLISIFFATMSFNIYIMSIYLSNIYQEIKQRPLYIIESVQRL